ncbi:MAG: hypothetical protein ACYDA6_01100 [Solirubrobacteraceae bacterium]
MAQRYAALAALVVTQVVVTSCAGVRPARGTANSAAGSLPAAHTERLALPHGWRLARLASEAALPFPVGWQLVAGDPGSASAQMLAQNGTVAAYLNATPAVASETTGDWTAFRLHHNAMEGDSRVHLIAEQRDAVLRVGRAACVIDSYATSRTSYIERACLLVPSDHSPAMVLVAAAQPAMWVRERPRLAFALANFMT